MKNASDHINYSAADIQRYVQGKMSAQEMHAMEKAALDDPFLADAIEGFQQGMQEHGEPVIKGQLQELRNEFQDRSSTQSKTRVIAFRWWQAAAAAVIVIAGAFWIYNSAAPNEKATMTVAQKEKAKQNEHMAPAPAPAVAPDQQATAPASVTDSATVPTQKTAPKKTTSTAVTKKPRIHDAGDENTAPPVAFAQAIDKKDTAAPMANNIAANEYLKKTEEKDARIAALDKAWAGRQNQVIRQESTAAVARKIDDYKNRETELITIGRNDSQAKQVMYDKKLSGFVKGRVTDPFNNPVANANVKIPNNNNYNILTDKTGYFKVPATTDSIVDVSVNVAGYGTQNFRLQNNASLNELQLQAANVALNAVEVKAIQPRTKKSKYQTRYPSVMMQDAKPVYGWVSYDQYLENNKKVPADPPSLKGNVAISFVVNKKGELSDFKVEQSLAKSYDDEAIRLISQGPAWKLLKGRKARITVIVRF